MNQHSSIDIAPRIVRWLRLPQQLPRPVRLLIGLALFALVNGLIIYYLLRDWRTLSLNDIRLNGWMLAACFAVQSVGILLGMYVWTLMLQQLGYRIGMRQHFKNYMLSNLARYIPGFVWGIVGRAYLYERDGGAKLDISLASVLEMVIFGMAGAIVALAALALPGSRGEGFSPLLLLGLVALCGVLAHPRVSGAVSRRLQARYPERQINLHWYHLPLWTLLNVVTVALGSWTLYWFCQALYPDTGNILVPAVQGWALTVVSGSLLFWMPIEVGISSGVLVLLLATAMPLPHALMTMVAWRVWNGLVSLVFGLAGLGL